MRPIGNSLIIIAQLILISIPVFACTALLMTVLFGCNDVFATDDACTWGGVLVEDTYAIAAGWFGLSAFVVIPLVVPLFAVGLLLRWFTKSNAALGTSKTDEFVTYFTSKIILLFKLFFMAIFWWATIIVFIYQTIKLKSFGQAFAVLKNFVRGT